MRLFTSAALAVALGVGALASVAPSVGQAQIGFGISVGFAPPPLPVYDQPPCPGYGYIWTPGYWAWSDYENDYYWVPGTWIEPPRVGYLWTPGYWGFNDGAYIFNAGYWGPTIGFYGGIDYGFGYGGYGYEGGYWNGGQFYYNRTVNNITNNNITNVYNRPAGPAQTVNRVSFNGGQRGVQAVPTNQQLQAARQPRLAATPVQLQHVQAARTDPSLRASFNHGAPPVAATMRPGLLRGPGVVAASHASTFGRGGFTNTGSAGYGSRTAQTARSGPGPATAAPRAAPYRQAQARYGQTGYGQTSYGQTGYGQTRYGQARGGVAGSGANAYHASPPRYAQTPRSPYGGGYAPPARATQAYGANAYRPSPQHYAQAPRSPYGGGYAPPARAPQAYGGGFRAQAAPRQPQVARVARAAPAQAGVRGAEPRRPF